MKTSQEIRRENLAILLKEAGSAATLARTSKVPAPYISQLTNQIANKSGKVRTMGDDTARKLERGMEKPLGWIDADHSAAPDDLADVEAEIATMMRTMDVGGRRAALHAIRGIFNGQQEASEPVSTKGGRSLEEVLGKHIDPHPNVARKTNVQKRKRK